MTGRHDSEAQLARWASGDPITAVRLNAIVDAIIKHIVVSPPLRIERIGNTIYIRFDETTPAQQGGTSGSNIYSGPLVCSDGVTRTVAKVGF